MEEINVQSNQNNNKKLNIAIVCDPITDYTAGSFVSTMRFAEALAKRGHKIIFIAAKSPNSRLDEDIYHGMKIYRFFSLLMPKSEKKLYISFPAVGQIKKILINEAIDVLHVIIPTPSAIVSIKAAKALNIKVVSHSHTQPENLFLHLPKMIGKEKINHLFNKVLTWLYKKTDALIYPSEFAKNIFVNISGDIRSIVVSNGVDREKFKKVEIADFITKYELLSTTKNILFVGRFHPEKSIETLIKAIPLVAEKLAEARLFLVGFGHQEEKLKKLIKEMKLDEKIIILGKLSDEDLVKAYNFCDVFVLPSLAELEGMVVLEAMACGKPIVIANSSASASPYFVDNNGLLFEPENHADLAEKLITILADDELRQNMGEVSLEKSKKYDINYSVNQIEELYYSIIKNS